MTNKFSTIVLSASAAVAMLFACATVSSAGAIATDLCLLISDAPVDVAAELGGVDLSSLGSKECKKVCKEAKKLCTTLAKNRADCRSSVNSTDSKATQAGCTIDFPGDKDQRKNCQKQAKQTEKDNKKSIKDEEKSTTKDGCQLLDDDCQTNCGSAG